MPIHTPQNNFGGPTKTLWTLCKGESDWQRWCIADASECTRCRVWGTELSHSSYEQAWEYRWLLMRIDNLPGVDRWPEDNKISNAIHQFNEVSFGISSNLNSWIIPSKYETLMTKKKKHKYFKHKTERLSTNLNYGTLGVSKHVTKLGIV